MKLMGWLPALVFGDGNACWQLACAIIFLPNFCLSMMNLSGTFLLETIKKLLRSLSGQQERINFARVDVNYVSPGFGEADICKM